MSLRRYVPEAQCGSQDMPSYRFDRYELLPEARRLIHDGHDLAVGLRVFDVITYLVENRERAIGRDELISAVWGRVDAGDALLAQAVLKARRAFGDDGNAQHHIRTVPRFGYQWVAPTCAATPGDTALDGSVADAANDPVAPPPAMPPAAVPAAVAAGERLPRARGRWLFALVAVLALAAFGIAWKEGRFVRAPATAVAPVPGLILVVPTRVQGMLAEDGWMRLGVMSLSAQALLDVPGHAVVPDETALAAVAQAGTDPDIARLRAATGATLVVTSEASHAGNDWLLSATVFGADGKTQMVNANASDPVVAAGALAKNLHDLLAPGAGDDEAAALPPDVIALVARMRAAILAGQNGRALQLSGQAAAATAAAPAVALLRAEALIQLGRADEAATLLQSLLGTAATDPAPHWLAGAWSALGDCELARGHPDLAEAHFRRSLALPGAAGDRRTSGLAWRGLGIAQAMRNDLEAAAESYQQARLQLEPIGDRLILARVTDGLGYVTAQRGRMADALLLYQQAASMGAAFGANETELGSRLNIAQSQQYLLQHAAALDSIRSLLPRLRGLDYPALHRFGLAAYVTALVETGALGQAREELAHLDAEAARNPGNDAVVDVRLDEAQARLAVGDVAGSIRQAESVRASLDADGPPDLRLETVALLLQAEGGRDDEAARALAADRALWQPANALAPARVHALVAQAGWQARLGNDDAAGDTYRQALALARGFGVPVILRDAAVPYAGFQLAHGGLDAARATAGVLGPYAEDDFACALLLARLAAAAADPTLAHSYFARARGLGGERWTAALAAEDAAAGDATGSSR